MIANLIAMNGYGIFVWTSFCIVLFACVALYLKTKKTLKKYEKEFVTEFEALSSNKKNEVFNSSKIVRQVLATNSKTN